MRKGDALAVSMAAGVFPRPTEQGQSGGCSILRTTASPAPSAFGGPHAEPRGTSIYPAG